ncbi:MAG: glycosyltransferase family 4 protein [Fimbriimonadaceae bacterium]|nr:glycosyltransferase family 4 protein [Fimbriimonadaceae bacterium]
MKPSDSPLPLVAIDARLVSGSSTGDSTYWTGLVRALLRRAPEFRYLLLSNVAKPPEIPETSHSQWVVVPGRSSRWWSLVSFPMAARRAGADVLHTQYTLSPLAGKHAVTTIHDVSFLIGPEWFQPKDRLLLTQLVGPSARRAARVVTVSQTSRRDIVRLLGLPEAKVVATPLAASEAIERMEIGDARALVARAFGLEGPFCLTVGTRWPRKNMQLAVDAVEGLGEAFPHRLALTGKAGWGEGELGARTVPLGYVEERQLSALYSCADVFLAPSRYEGFGLTLLEAFRCGCPVVASVGGSHPEVAGDAARLVPEWDAESWSAALRELLGDSSNLAELRQRGPARAAAFSWDETARLTAEVYREVLL